MISRRLFLLFTIISLCAGCNALPTGYIEPINNLPSTEIAYLKDNSTKGTLIGFINLDGTKKTDRKIFYETNIFRIFSSDTSAPFFWSMDNSLGLLKNNTVRMNAGYPILVLPDGIIKKCPDEFSPWTTKPFFIKNDVLIILNELEINKEIIIEFDMTTCTILRKIYQPSSGEKITSFSLSPMGEIAVSISSKKENFEGSFTRILTKSKLISLEIPNSTNYLWGQNGKSFIYYKTPDYELIFCEGINQECRSLGFNIDHPSLSRDEKWLIYDYAGKIFRKNIMTLEIEYITDGSFPIYSN